MKKILIIIVLLFSLSACSKKENESSLDNLLNTYSKGIVKFNVEQILSVYPNFMQKDYKKNIYEKSLDYYKEYYGNSIKVAYEVTNKTKLSKKELNNLNNDIKKKYIKTINFDECYKIDGYFTYSGSKKKDDKQVINNMWYCRTNDKWNLVD